jgi:hypothetical protein
LVFHPSPRQEIAKGQCIHHGRQHTHAVTHDAIHTGAGQVLTAKQVTASHNDRDFSPGRSQRGYIRANALKHIHREAEPRRSTQSLSTELQQEAFQS